VSNSPLSYAVVTPVRNEAVNLRRLCAALAAQTVLPSAWVVVDTGSTDDTLQLVEDLAAEHGWIRPARLEGAADLARGGPIARAFELGYELVRDDAPDVVVKLDADTSFEAGYFERLLSEFSADATLGMASGTCHELERGVWRERHVTGSTVWGASRCYRTGCLEDVLPLEQRMGWDGVDEFRANARGWRTATFKDLPFHHHRREGERDGARHRARLAQGRAARYIGYRFWYLLLRSLWHARREPAALAMIWGYLRAARAREPRLADPEATSYLRRQQSLRRLPRRAAEAVGIRRAAA
jgi:glycosyltransferase involved in cell wall biosynthesis